MSDNRVNSSDIRTFSCCKEIAGVELFFGEKFLW